MTDTEKLILGVVVGLLVLQKFAGANAPPLNPNLPPGTPGGPLGPPYPPESPAPPIFVQPVGVVCLDENGIAYTIPTGPCPVMQLPPAGATGSIPPGLGPPVYTTPIPVV